MWIVMEIQKNGDQIATVVNAYADKNEAKAKYHTILAAAAVSKVEQHGATFFDDKGTINTNEYYEHPVEPEESE